MHKALGIWILSGLLAGFCTSTFADEEVSANTTADDAAVGENQRAEENTDVVATEGGSWWSRLLDQISASGSENSEEAQRRVQAELDSWARFFGASDRDKRKAEDKTPEEDQEAVDAAAEKAADQALLEAIEEEGQIVTI